jgi:hypothetical protein
MLAWICSALPAWAWTGGGVVPNQGQLDPSVRYYGFVNGGAIYFTGDAVVFDLEGPAPDEARAIWMRFQGAQSPRSIEVLDATESRLSYFLGRDSGRWQSNLPVYRTLIYRDLWPGVDLRFDASAAELRYEVLAHDGADPAAARFEFEGQDDAASEGALRITEIGNGNLHALRWGTASAGGPPVADNPSILLWSTFFGGSAQDRPHGLYVDAAGNSYITGYTWSHNLPTTSGAYDRTHNGEYDVYVAKLSSGGSALLWATFLGGSVWDRAFAVRQDEIGNVVVAGLTFSANFPATPGAFDETLAGERDAFCAKLSPDGSTLLWATYIGGSNTEWGWDMILDSQDRPIVVGETLSGDFPTTPGAYDQVVSSSDAFVIKLEADGSGAIWSTVLGGNFLDQATRVVLAADDAPIVCGNSNATTYPTTTGAIDTTPNGRQDAIVAMLAPDGSSLLYSTVLGGSDDDWGNGLAISASGEVVIAGSTSSPLFPVTAGAFDESHNGMQDIFLTRIDFASSTPVWSTLLGGNMNDEPFSFILDRDDCPIVSGQVDSENFPTTPNGYDLTYNGGGDAFLTRLDPSGSQLYWSSFLGGSLLDQGWELYLHPTGDPILAGPTYSTDFPTTAGGYDPTHSGSIDDFISRFRIVTASGVDENSGFGKVTALRATPNPASGNVAIEFALPSQRFVTVRAFDAGGRCVATIDAGIHGAGSHLVRWDGRDDTGRPVVSGTYWIHMAGEESIARSRVVIVR